MTVGELKEELEYLETRNKISDHTEIRMAQQPRWAFEYSFGDKVAVVTVSDEDYPEDDPRPVVYLEEGSQIGYLPSKVAEEIGW